MTATAPPRGRGLIATVCALSGLLSLTSACGRVGYDPVSTVVDTQDALVSPGERRDLPAAEAMAPADGPPEVVARDGGTPPMPDAGAESLAPSPPPEAPRDAAVPELAMAPADAALPDVAAPVDQQPESLAPVDAPPERIVGQATCPPPVLAAEVIADFEQGETETKAAGGRQAMPISLVSTGAGDFRVPPAGTATVCGSTRVLTFSATSIAAGRGHLQVRTRSVEIPTFDARAYSGLRLIARADRRLGLALKVPDSHTVGTGPPYDHFTGSLEITTESRAFTVPFSVLRQPGVRPPRPAVDLRTMYAVELQVLDAGTFTLVIDDLVFLR